MTVKLTVVYGTPEDTEAFDQHYFNVHMPLASAMPGLQRVEVAKVSGSSPYHLITELYFADRDALDAAFGSEQGAATGKDYGEIAPPNSFMAIAEVLD